MSDPTPVTTRAMSAESGSQSSPARTPSGRSQSNQGTCSGVAAAGEEVPPGHDGEHEARRPR